MRKISFLIALFAVISAQGQNFQLHYDFGKARAESASDRQHFTSTFEMFKPDKLGSTFWFIDLDFNAKNNNMSLAYLEIGRNMVLPKLPVQYRLEYNGGLYLVPEVPGVGGYIKQCWLTGLAYPFQLGSGSFEIQALYKYFRDVKEGPDFQVTGIFFYPFLDGKVHFSGFVDLWTEDKMSGTGSTSGKKLIFLTEPQIWYNIHSSFAVGGEVEISKNFVFLSDQWEFFPTLAVKWNF
jgi:hypothetical protein